MNRRQAMATMLALPAVATAATAAPDLPACPSWATDWDDAAASLANLEEGHHRRHFPRTAATVSYTSACQFGRDTVLLYGMRDWSEMLRHLTCGRWDILGWGVSEHGTAWGIIALGVFSEGIKAELRYWDARREARQLRAEQAVWR